MEANNRLLKLLIFFPCFSLTVYLGTLQLEDYVSNQDGSFVTYKTFANVNDQVFPTFSVCLVAEPDYPGSMLLNYKHDDPCNNQTYRDNQGSKCEESCTKRKYGRIIAGIVGTFNDEDKACGTTSFDDWVINLKDITAGFHTNPQNTQLHSHTSTGQWSSNGFFISYQDSMRVCFSKENDPKGIFLGVYSGEYTPRYDYLEIDAKDYAKGPLAASNIEVFVHQKDRLLKKLGMPTYTLDRRSILGAKDDIVQRPGYTGSTYNNGFIHNIGMI